MTADLQVAPRLPWRPEDTRRACRGRVLVRLRDVREHVPHGSDVALGALSAALRLDVPSVDRAVAARSTAMRVTRPYFSARNLATVGRRHLGWADDELDLGLARTFRIDLDPDTSIVDLVSALAELEAVESASPVYLADCPFSADGGAEPGELVLTELDDWAPLAVQASAALAQEPGDPTIIIAIIDSGVAIDHPELRGRCRAGADLVDLPEADISRGIHLLGDYSRRDHRPHDEIGHGTACAGILGARGLSLPPGMAGASPLLPMRALAAAKIADRPRPTALGTLSDIDVAVKLAVDLGARVCNLSFGTPESALRASDPVPHAEIVEYALGRGCVLVAASGNSGDDLRYFPAALPGVIAVGAIGRDRRPAPFSTRGDHVLLCAPGQHIRCAGLSGLTAHNGTSFAAPFVAGAAALVLAAAARRLVPLSPFEVRDLLLRTVAPFAGAAEEHRGSGAGILDAAAAVAAACALRAHELHEPGGPGSDDDVPELPRTSPALEALGGPEHLPTPHPLSPYSRSGALSSLATSTMGLETATIGASSAIASHLGRGADRLI